MSVEDLFRRLRAVLESSEVPYMLTGSHASAAYGTPRATQDIDIVIAPTGVQLTALLREFPVTEYYVSKEAARDALSRRTQFNVIDLATGWKIDFIVRKDREFSRTEFERRAPLDSSGLALDVASAEDTLISKLEWAKQGSSERQIEDAAGIVRSQRENLDVEYIEHWIRELHLEDQWKKAKEKAV